MTILHNILLLNNKLLLFNNKNTEKTGKTMKLQLLTLLMLFYACPLISMETIENNENNDKKTKAIVIPQEKFQPRSLKDTAARVAFYLLPQQPNLDAIFPALPTELTEEYINKPVDSVGRTPIFFANAEQIPTLVKHGATIDVKNKIDISTIEYFIREGNCRAAAQALSLTTHNYQSLKKYENLIGSLVNMHNKINPTNRVEFHRIEEDNIEQMHENLIQILNKLGLCQDNLFIQPKTQISYNLTNKTDLYYAQTPEKIAELLDKGYKINMQDIWREEPFLYHLQQNRPQCARALLNAGANLMLIDKNRIPLPILYAIKFGYNTLLPDLLTKEMKKYVNESSIDLIELAVENNNIIAMQLFLGTELNDSELAKGLLCATKKNHNKAIRILLNHVSHYDPENKEKLLNSKEFDGITPLIHTILECNAKGVKLLLKAGTTCLESSLIDTPRGQSHPLYYMYDMFHKKISENSQNFENAKKQQKIYMKKWNKIISHCKEHGCNINAIDKINRTLLIMAIGFSLPKVVKHLIDLGAKKPSMEMVDKLLSAHERKNAYESLENQETKEKILRLIKRNKEKILSYITSEQAT